MCEPNASSEPSLANPGGSGVFNRFQTTTAWIDLVVPISPWRARRARFLCGNIM
jgi:hypothetical protein